MTQTLKLLPPDLWFNQLFATKSAQRGGVVRRAVRDVERVMGRAQFEAMIKERGFQAIENGEQYIVLCNQRPVRLIR
ncbi:hypothetical protein C8N43_0547 [Litoreibacter ponti]|uniref:N-(5'-phosphoribosyl)anthranilate isomerase n=1 Tax=Litoreibacter ponti TaxID=1510457 RepID=A0A2T6BIL7_9RHOB|nr:N-(5'-phosphoribosyl)anthranilate isomerase [Litoreibacter ponti]PTX55899.1 hypothetical protein C8N43_0547 [Litoreibacter ponti]